MPDRHTLVMPTYNRPRDLSRNLRFLDAQGLSSKVVVLDSSTPKHRRANKAALADLSLDLTYREYPSDTHPFDKFADGVKGVETPFVSLCADDDILLPDGLEASLDALAGEPAAVCAHGYYGMFGFLQDAVNMDLTTMLYASPGIMNEDPLERLDALMQAYQALTYAVFRTPVLQEVYERLPRVEGLLFRELLSGALPALYGKIIRVPDFYMMRQHATGDDAARQGWHPYEWFMRDAVDLVTKYAAYREVLLAALQDIAPAADGATSKSRARALDLIHLRYLMRHFPEPAIDAALGAELRGIGIDGYWSQPAIQAALLDAHNSFAPPPGDVPLSRWVHEAFPLGAFDESGVARVWPLVRNTPVRSYRFYGALIDDKLSSAVEIGGGQLIRLCRALDAYPASATPS
jgi:glycosyltransferase domain-containing protein